MMKVPLVDERDSLGRDGARRVGELDVTGGADRPVIFVEVGCVMGAPYLEYVRLALSPPAAMEMSRQLRRAVKGYLRPQEDDGRE